MVELAPQPLKLSWKVNMSVLPIPIPPSNQPLAIYTLNGRSTSKVRVYSTAACTQVVPSLDRRPPIPIPVGSVRYRWISIPPSAKVIAASHSGQCDVTLHSINNLRNTAAFIGHRSIRLCHRVPGVRGRGVGSTEYSSARRTII